MRMQLLALVSLSHASPVRAATIATGAGPEIPWFRLAMAFAFCILVAWGAIALIRRRQLRGIANPLETVLGATRGSAERRIRIIETRRASQHGDLCLVELDGQQFFLALTANGVTVIERSPADSESGTE